jgi:integrase
MGPQHVHRGILTID